MELTKTRDNFYDQKFYQKQAQGSSDSAKIILPLVFQVLPKINSAVDFGCGVGTWVSCIKELGVNEIKGYDGSWAKDKLIIPQEYFEAVEFDKEMPKIKKKYDLAISLEVAEHLPEKIAKKFIETITSASDIVLFSAAIPFQGGKNHINEQWQDYWYNIFNEYGYVGTDFLRRRCYNEQAIELWYRQNIMLYVKKEKIETVSIPKEHFSSEQINFVCPEFYLKKVKEIKRLKICNANDMRLFDLYKLVFKRMIKRLLGKGK